MPLYEYRCTQCGNRYEKIQSFSAEPDTVCPKCGGKVERPLTAPALQFKGAGWYINDYAPKAAGGAGSGSGDKPAGDSAGSSDSKTEAKPTAAESKPASAESSTKATTPSSSSGTT